MKRLHILIECFLIMTFMNSNSLAFDTSYLGPYYKRFKLIDIQSLSLQLSPLTDLIMSLIISFPSICSNQ